jgi:enoyl-CoA hydratase/carnithine racemase
MRLSKVIARFCQQKSQGLVKVSNLEGKYQKIAQIELNQPTKKNALSISLLDEVSI